MLKIIILLLVAMAIAFSLVIGALVQNRLPWDQSPGYLERLKIYLGHNHVETRENHEWPELRTRIFNGSVELMHVLTEQSIIQLGWDMLVSDKQDRTIHAVVSSKLWKYKDDVHIRFSSDNDQHTRIELTSSSRKGRGDLGTNSRHVMDLYQQIEQNLVNNTILPKQ